MDDSKEKYNDHIRRLKFDTYHYVQPRINYVTTVVS